MLQYHFPLRPVLFTILCPAVNKFLHDLIKEMFLAEWQATQAQITPLTGHWQTECLLQHLGEDQTGDSQKETHQGYTEGVPKPQSAHVGRFQQFRCQCVCVCVWKSNVMQDSNTLQH